MARTIPVYAVIAPGTAVVIRRKSDTIKVVVLHICAHCNRHRLLHGSGGSMVGTNDGGLKIDAPFALDPTTFKIWGTLETHGPGHSPQ